MENKTIHGIITRGVGGLYGVRTSERPGEELLCRARGVFRKEQITPTVGDNVIISHVSGADDTQIPDDVAREIRKQKKNGVEVDWVIDAIDQRKNSLIRPPVANLDYLFAVIPCASPEPDLLTADKLTVIAENAGIETVVVIGKTDLNPEKSLEYAAVYEKAGYCVFRISCETGEGVDVLRDYIAEISSAENGYVSGAFAGVSGAGKSTLMTALFPDLQLKTGVVSRKTERGRHTTRHVELYPIPVGEGIFWLADTPGFSMLDFTRFDFFPYDELAGSFREFSECLGECRYTKCTHLKEEGCAVIGKMKDGRIAPSRHDSYIRIYEEQRSVPEWKRR